MENGEPSNHLCPSHYKSIFQSEFADIEAIFSIGKSLFVVPLTLTEHERSTQQLEAQVSSPYSVFYS